MEGGGGREEERRKEVGKGERNGGSFVSSRLVPAINNLRLTDQLYDGPLCSSLKLLHLICQLSFQVPATMGGIMCNT